jgi:hypothetical protein
LPKRKPVTLEWLRQLNEDIYALYSTSNIIRVIKSRRMNWAGHIAHMGERTGACRDFMGKSERIRTNEDVGIDESIRLNGSSRSGMGH